MQIWRAKKLKTIAVVGFSLVIGLGGAFAACMAQAADSGNRMQACAIQWNQLKAQGKTRGVEYKVYSANCLKGQMAAPIPSPQPVKASMVPSPAPAMTSQARMAACAGKWNQMKASAQTKGMTYQQFSATCLKN